MKLHWQPVTVGLAPLLISHVCHALSAAAGVLPLCLPYVEGCVSMSAAARYPPANYLFDALMIPTGVLMIVFWSQTRSWLISLSAPRGAWVVGVLGIAAGCFMINAAVFLGEEESYTRLMRRVGINGYVLLNMFAQFTLTRLLWTRLPRTEVRPLLGFNLAVILMGIMSAVEDIADWRNNDIDNIIEWSCALFLSLYFVWLARVWGRAPGTRARLGGD